MTAPNLPRVTPSAAPSGPGAARRGWSSHVRVGRYGPRLLLRCAFVGLALVVLVLLLTGCGNGELPASWQTPVPPSSSAAPTTSSSPTPSPTPAPTTTRESPSPTATPDSTAPSASQAPRTDGGDGTGGSGGGQAQRNGAGTPIWPAADSAAAQRMQQQADRGGDPWLLDPEEVTISYVGAELGFRDPSLSRLAPGTYAVSDGRSPARATVTLEQTVRQGPGGIWLVTHVDRS
ncbi:hypothetical protein SAMN05216207_104229 [Pseudonocardia ammonioxydans]|uniref:Uncharacterized protein n=1 Tax=Pseudonocardia ammonioxydans TaxID=260086 RepID=A0A1I5G0Z7_PSUAM|nr:hypothetical protein [Pseudonocardia ammonioxydans]SFO29697.1 hypothetical protein SAMN05216207_104229 [Pseudonocardia ammonioxydans]